MDEEDFMNGDITIQYIDMHQRATRISDGMDVLIVGSIAYDSITSPQGFAPHTLGGSATYAGLAASFPSKTCESTSLLALLVL